MLGMMARAAAPWFAALVALTGAPALAEGANPELIARDYFSGDGPTESRALKVSRLDLKVVIVGNIAAFTAQARFDNPTDDSYEGDLTFDMPAGAVVTGYALDVDDRMVDGVLVDHRKALLAYEDRLRRGVDPGIAEVTRTNAFRTRVSPIPAHGGRTISLGFTAPIDAETGLTLPLDIAAPVGEVSIKVTVAGGRSPPSITAPDGMTLRWVRTATGWEAEASAKQRPLSGRLRIGGEGAPRLALSLRPDGERFFEINDVAEPPKGPAAAPRRVRIYWDRSLSRRADDLKGEIALVRRYLEVVRPQQVELVQFSSDKPQISLLSGADLAAQTAAALEAVTYRGATSVADLGPSSRADICLLVSDGNITLDAYRPKRLPCPVFALSSADDANAAFLAATAEKTSGEYIDLRRATADEALARMTRQSPRVLSVDAVGLGLDFVALPARGRGVHIVGRVPSGDAVFVTLAGEREPRRYDLRGPTARFDGAAALWAAAEAGDMGATDQPDRKRVLALARRYSVAAGDNAFIVLETGADYANAEIAPPPSAGKELIAYYREMVEARAREKREAREERLAKVIESWKEQKEWWNTRFDPRPVPKRRDAERGFMAAPPPPPPPPAPAIAARAPATGGPDLAEVVVTAERRRSDSQRSVNAVSHQPAVEIEMAPWSPDRPYLKALAAAPPANFWAVFDAQEREHGALPAFYLDVAEWLFRQGRADEAVQMAVSALELPVADVTTLAIVADRLERYGQLDRALWMYERILFLEPDRPQPRRTLALALIARAEARKGDPARDYARALSLLDEVVQTPWRSAYDGIELISLMEINRTLERARAVGADTGLDKRLQALLDVDLRVVLEWNTDITDMDLWVDEPAGERAIYSNPLTAIGGHLSNDMTQGYGPEEYLLRRAKAGTYKISANVYATDRLNPNGAVTVRAKLFRDYGRPGEKAEVLEIELKPDDDGEKLVGTFKVGNKGGGER